MSEAPLPFKPGDWVQGAGDRVAYVRAVYRDRGEVLLDLVLYGWDGEKTGRESPACGGPRTFEPACGSDGWERIKAPNFPIRPTWVPDGNGHAISRMWGGQRLGPANYTPRKRRGGGMNNNDRLRIALQQIADGDNDARAVARKALGI